MLVGQAATPKLELELDERGIFEPARRAEAASKMHTKRISYLDLVKEECD